MKKLSLSMLSLIFCATLHAQEVPKPEFTDIPYLWNKQTNELVNLAKEKANLKVSGLGAKFSYKFSGKGSGAKVAAMEKTSFLINSSMPALLQSMTLYKLTIKGKNRQAEVVKGKMFSGTIDTNSEGAIDFNTKKITDDTYELVVSSKLIPGEYAISNGMNSFTFSVIE